jgi:hypothetical protein
MLNILFRKDLKILSAKPRKNVETEVIGDNNATTTAGDVCL